MNGKVTSISRPKIDYWRITCDCMGPEVYGWAQFHIVEGSDKSVLYVCTNCGTEHPPSCADEDPPVGEQG